jgi:hypothetical protein
MKTVPSADGLLVVDYAQDGKPIGVEITAPSALRLDRLNRSRRDAAQRTRLPPSSGCVSAAPSTKRFDRLRDKLREELTLVQMDRHASELEEMDVEGILAFGERVLPNASSFWVQSSLNQKQRLRQLVFS